MLKFGLNQVTMSEVPLGHFVDTAADLGCVGVELRNDLGRPLFEEYGAHEVGRRIRSAGMRLLGLSQIYPFNHWSDAIAEESRALIDLAQEAGAETISLIPANDSEAPTDTLLSALEHILPLLEKANVVGLIEPLGFAQASLRSKEDVVDAIETLGAPRHLRLVHDTFHHTLADGRSVCAAHTGLVHISGVKSQATPLRHLEDADRVLVDGHDRLDTLSRPLFAGDPEVRILGYGKEQMWKQILT